MVSRSGPLTLIPMGARIPDWSMTIRAAMGWSLGADVVPGSLAVPTISFQMSSAFRISGRQFRKGPSPRVRDQLALLVTLELPGLVVVAELETVSRGVLDVLGLVVDHRLHHGDGGGIEGALHPADLSHHLIHLGDGVDGLIQLLEDVESLLDRGVGHGGGHVQVRALVEVGHELLSQTGKSVAHGHPGAAGDEEGRVETRGLHSRRDEPENAGKAQPHHSPEQNQTRGEEQEGAFVLQTPGENGARSTGGRARWGS